MFKQVEELVNNEIRPFLRKEAGDITLEGVTNDGIVRVKVEGIRCCCCSTARVIQRSIEQTLKQKIPKVKKVEFL